MMKKRFFRCNVMVSILGGTLLLAGTGCPPASETTVSGESSGWARFVEEFLEGQFAANPGKAVNSGRHEFDGQLPDWRPEGIRGEIRRLHAQRKEALTFDTAGLDESQQFERDYLIAQIAKDLFWLETAESPFRNPTFYSGTLDPNVYVTREYAPLETRMRAYLKYLDGIPAAARQVRQNLRTPLPRSYVEIGITAFGGLASYYENDVPGVFAPVKDSTLQEEFRNKTATATTAMRELVEWLESLRAGATEAFALGPDKFLKMLRDTEQVEISLDRLEQIGREDLERNVQSLREACRQYAPGASIADCMAKARTEKPEGGAVVGARRQLKELKKFLVDENLVSIPGTEEALVDESPPYQRWNFAYIDIPGPYEKGLPSTYYIAPPDPSWTPEEQNEYVPSRSNLLFVSVHEVWPGHFLNFLHANRSDSMFGRVFVGYAFAEGWAHYTEEMLWEAGLGNGDPVTHIGQLSNALLRNGRFLSTIGLHTQGMTLEESERLFREQAFQDAGTARQQAARGTFDPAYLNYTMGKLMIRKLREDWTASRGGRQAWREFHDRFLSYGGPPIPLVREAMLGSGEGSPL